MPAFTLPPHRLRRRPRSNRHPAAAVIHNGLSTEKLSTSLLAALCKTFSPSRLRTRIYNISFALAPLWHRGPRRRAQGGGGRRQRRPRPRAVPNHAACCAEPCRLLCRIMPLVVPNHAACVPNNAACVPNNAAYCAEQCRLCADQCRLLCRITVRKGGSAAGQPRHCPCALPAAVCLWLRPRRLIGDPVSAGGRKNDRMAHRRTTTPTHRTPRGNDTCTIRVP